MEAHAFQREWPYSLITSEGLATYQTLACLRPRTVGAKERGELESRVTKLISEVKDSGDVILMIDEIHTLVGAGSVSRGGGGGLDISNLIKPALARGEFQVGGTAGADAGARQ